MRTIRRHISICLVFLTIFCSLAAAQDSTRRVTQPPTTPQNPSPGASVGNPNLTVPPIILPANQPRKPRRRRLTTADSVRLAAQRDSMARVAQAAANGSAFNIGTNNAPSQTATQTVDTAAVMATTAPTTSVPEVPILEKSDNPLDILRGAPRGDLTAPMVAKPMVGTSAAAPSLLDKQTYSKNFLLWIFLLTLILMAFVVANARLAINNAYSALLSNNALRQIYRDQLGWGSIPQLALYMLFWLNAGIFSFLMMYRFGIRLPFGQFGTFLACVGGVSVIFLIKHAILYIIASVFPISKEIKTYNYVIITAGILLGLMLLPLNIFIAYSPASFGDLFVYLAFIAIGLMYLVRSFRSLSVASPFLITDQFHFLLYLCTVEIAPVMILIKFMLHKSPM